MDPLHGMDVSQFQGLIRWTQAVASGIQFAFIRIADGATYRDTRFVENWRATEGLCPRGTYQYFRPGEDPIKQAEFVLEELAQQGHGELVPMLDAERSTKRDAKTRVAPEVIAEGLERWVEYVEAEIEGSPIVYTGKDFWEVRVKSQALKRCPLGIAQYTRDPAPTIPKPWDDWALWQWTNEGIVPGIVKIPGITSGFVDLLRFKGTLEDLLALGWHPRSPAYCCPAPIT